MYIKISLITCTTRKRNRINGSNKLASCILSYFNMNCRYLHGQWFFVFIFMESTCSSDHFDIKHLHKSLMKLLLIKLSFCQNETRIQIHFTICVSEYYSTKIDLSYKNSPTTSIGL